MSDSKRNPTTPSTALALGLVGPLVAGACGQQATEDYAGEPLLAMTGQALIEAPTGGEAIEPALCFFSREKLASLPGDGASPTAPWDPATLPADVQALLAWPEDPELPSQHPPFFSGLVAEEETFIRGGTTEGDFPTHFSFRVYEAPPDRAIVSPFEGEPAVARGGVCAVRPGHRASSRRVYTTSLGLCSPSACYGRKLLASSDTPERAYAEAYTCPPGGAPQTVEEAETCARESVGDSSLRFEQFSEFVIGVAVEHMLIYLAEPASAESYLVWSLGLTEGLGAGYHLFTSPPFDELAVSLPACSALVHADALAEIIATYEADIKAEFGEDQGLSRYPMVTSDDGVPPAGLRQQYVPDHVYAGGQRIFAEHEMAKCPLPPTYLEVDLSSEDVAFEVKLDPGTAPGPLAPF